MQHKNALEAGCEEQMQAATSIVSQELLSGADMRLLTPGKAGTAFLYIARDSMQTSI